MAQAPKAGVDPTHAGHTLDPCAERGFKRPESVLVVVATRAGEVLLLERRSPQGFRQSVTGSLRAGETYLEAARRELHEETGIQSGESLEDLEMGARFRIRPEWRARFGPDVFENRERWFRLWLSRRVAVRLNPREHVRHEWVGAAQAAVRTDSWSNRAAIQMFILPELKAHARG